MNYCIVMIASTVVALNVLVAKRDDGAGGGGINKISLKYSQLIDPVDK